MGLWSAVWGTCVQFGEGTSIAGLSNASRAKGFVRKICWMAVFVVFFEETIRGCVNTFEEIFQYPVVTETDLSYQPSVDFPAITVCNLNRINCRNLFLTKVEFENLENDTVDTNETSYWLTDIFETSGCKDQVCNNMELLIPDVRGDNNTNTTGPDTMVKLISKIRCPSKQDRNCYYLQFMIDEAETDDEKKEVEQYFKELKCTLDIVCKYKQCKPPGPGPPGDYTGPPLPPSCPDEPAQCGPSGPSGPQGQRRKRQAPDDGPPPPPLPIVAADYYNDAKFLRKYMSIPTDTRLNIGHKFTSMEGPIGDIKGFISSCTFKGTNCKVERFWQATNTPDYGNCFTFNSAYNTDDELAPRNSSLTGTNYGLSMELFLDQTSYMLRKLSKQAGARLVIHSPRFPPMPNEYGIDLQPNTASSIAIQKHEIRRMAAPYQTNCTERWEDTGYDVDTDIDYSLASCQRYCYQLDIVKDCNCFHPFLVQPGFNTTFGSKPCRIVPNDTIADYVCFSGVLESFDNRTRQCSCNVSCSEEEFAHSIATSTWPSNQYWIDLALDLGYPEDILNARGKKAEEIKAIIQQDYLKIDIYYQTLNVKSILQGPKFSGNNILSTFGGALSLYLGIALVMLLELLELIVDLFFAVWAYGTGGKK